MSNTHKIWFAIWLMLAPLLVSAGSQIIGGLPFTLTNGTVADATQVMADFNQIVNNTNANAAKNGVNADITALSALATPLTNVQGGTTLFTSSSAATGTANAQVVATPVPTGLALASRPTLYFLPVATNTGATTLNANSTGVTNIFKPSFSGPVALTGGEIVVNTLAQVSYDGTRWLLAVDTPAFGIATNLASAATTDLGTIGSHVVQITGTTGITAFGSTASVDAPIYKLRFSGIVTITYNASSMILPGALSITTAANDTAEALYLGSGNWQISQYQRSIITPDVQVFTATGANTWTRPTGTIYTNVFICGAGGGGGGGHRSAGSALGTGGGGGGSGFCAQQNFKAADAGTSQTVTIGTGGTAGAGATVNGNAGTTGGAGGNSTFGTLLTGFGGGAGSSTTAGGSGGAGGGLTGAGGAASGTTRGASESGYPSITTNNGAGCDGGNAATIENVVWTCLHGGGGGGASVTTGASAGGAGAAAVAAGAGGGGAGGGHVAGNTGSAGGAGGKATGCATAPPGGAAGVNNGTSTAADFNYHPGCGGGGGGGANGTGTGGGTGGAGTSGGGGGGGGSGDNGNAGSGGGGGNGFAIVTSW